MAGNGSPGSRERFVGPSPVAKTERSSPWAAGRAAETAGMTAAAADTAATGAGAFSLMISASGVARTGTAGGGVTTAAAGGSPGATPGATTGATTGAEPGAETGVGADLLEFQNANPPPIRTTAASAANIPSFLDGAGAETSGWGGLAGKSAGVSGAAALEVNGTSVAMALGTPRAMMTVASVKSVARLCAELAKSGNIESEVSDVLSWAKGPGIVISLCTG